MSAHSRRLKLEDIMKNYATFTQLSDRQSRALLRRHNVGRIAFAFKNRVDVQPIGYVLKGKWLYGRTSAGSKLTQLKRSPWVAFQVDEVDGMFDWKSVVVQGTVYLLSEDDPEFVAALGLLRGKDRRVLSADDPAPLRTTLFRIYLHKVTGRRAQSSR